MKREIKNIKPLCSGCCPGHDEYPDSTYSSNRSKRARSRSIACEHRHARRFIKQQLLVDTADDIPEDAEQPNDGGGKEWK